MQVQLVLVFLVCHCVFAFSPEGEYKREPRFSTPRIIEDCQFLFKSMWDSANSSRYHACRPCGDNLCSCCGRSADPHWTPESADCPNDLSLESFTYIPKLPETIQFLYLITSLNMTQHFFSNVTSVMYLRLFMTDSAQSIDRSLFIDMKNLTGLVVTSGAKLSMDFHANILSLPGLRCFAGLDLDEVLKAFKNMTSDVIYMRSFQFQSLTYRALDMSRFCLLTNLRYLDLYGSEFDFQNYESMCVLGLKYLRIYSEIKTFPPTCITLKPGFTVSLMPNLTELHLEGNQISYMPFYVCLPSLEVLNLRINNIKKWDIRPCYQNLFENIPAVPMSLEGTAVAEDVTQNRDFWKEPVSCFPNLRHLDISLNRLVTIPIFKTLPKLEVLDLSSNAIYSFPEGAFQQAVYPNLKTLRLERQCTNTRRYVEIGKRAFRNPSLDVITIDDNRIRFKERNPFSVCQNLRDLRISDTQIDPVLLKNIDFFQNLTRLELVNVELSNIPDGTFDSLIQLRTLNLSRNRLTYISEKTFSRESRQRLTLLDLSRNAFVCSCELMWFRDWFVSNPELFTNEESLVKDYECVNLPDTIRLKDFDMTQQACLLSRGMSVIIILSISGQIGTLVAAALVFRFRWHIRLAIYEAFKGRGDVRRLRLQAQNFDYDVFVSYASEDLPWVRQHLMPQLEQRMGLRLCIHERDFIPGQNIVDNIVECVQSSKKILMVFSKDFVLSQWCQFELAFCLTHVMDHEDALVVVCVDDVTSRQMTSAMMAVLKTTTYIQWEEMDDAMDSFWGRLRVALREIMELQGPGP